MLTEPRRRRRGTVSGNDEARGPSVAEGRRARRERLLELIDRRRLGAVLLRRCANFAWYTGGADSSVERANPLGVADVVVTPATELVLASTMSGPRMRAEQVPWAEVIERPWHEADAEDAGAILRQLGVDGPLGADVPIAGATDVGEQVAAHRRVLDPDAIDRLRGVGADATGAIDDAAAKVEPGVSEPDLAAELAAACRRRGLIATVLLVGADQRIEQFRHPIPSAKVVQRTGPAGDLGGPRGPVRERDSNRRARDARRGASRAGSQPAGRS